MIEREHDCGPYCRAGRHASVVWAAAHVADAPTGLRAFCQAQGLAFVHAEPAPEAQPSRMMVGGWQDGVIAGITHHRETDTPWLVIWERGA